MSHSSFVYVGEQASHDSAIEEINEEAFGPGRFTRAAYRIREQGGHDRGLSYVALDGDNVIGSVRMTPIVAGGSRAMLLGPLAVRPAYKNIGVGRKLMAMAIGQARSKAAAPLVILVGDLPYYSRAGFSRVAPGQVTFPGPVDPTRILALELVDGAMSGFSGAIVHAGP